MDLSRAAEYLPLIEAAAAGKTIEHLTSWGEWKEKSVVAFNSPPENYRIKPDPIEVVKYLLVRPDGGATSFCESSFLRIQISPGDVLIKLVTAVPDDAPPVTTCSIVEDRRNVLS